jgi:hypothetical protein
LEKIKIPNKVTTIPQLLFFGCTKLNEVVLSENTVTIDQDAFQNCKSLTEITIPDSIEVIDNTAFEGCENLVTVYCKKGSVADNQELYPAEVTFVYTDDTPQILYGDADNNGLLTANDASVVLQKVLNDDFELPIQTATDNYMNYIDVDGNKILTANDAASILQKVLNLDYKFPVESDV